MPELPEIETYRTLLAAKIVGKTIQDVDVQREKSVNVPIDAFVGEVRGSVVIRMTRRAKHLVFHLDNGKLLVLHLMLGGWMFYGTIEQKPDRTTQIVLSFPEGQKLFFIGLGRKIGCTKAIG